jgi:hypothetical protein
VRDVKRGLSILGVMTVTLLAGCDGCSKRAAEAEAADTGLPSLTSPSASSSSASSASGSRTAAGDGGARRPPWSAVPSATANILPNMGIPDRFEAEQKARPAGIKPNVESVFAALEGAGLTVVDKKQHLGQTFGARYCVGARVVDKKGGDGGTEAALLQMSVCEFVNADVAAQSRDYSTEALKIIPNRAIRANKQTTLTIRDESPVTPAIEAAAAKAFTTYDAL